MRLSSGDTLGHYKIHSLIGRGGMGEVYRALDTKLEREVAIKVLPARTLKIGGGFFLALLVIGIALFSLAGK